LDKGKKIKREDKEKQAAALREELRRARAVILSSFEKLTVAQDTELRRKLAQTGPKYKVVKNALIERAAQGTPVEAVAQELRGTTSLAYTETDPVALAKALTAYAEQNPALTFKTGVVEGRVIALDELTMVANLPAREQLLSQVLFLIQSPARRAAGSLAAAARNLAFVMQQAVKEGKFKGPAGNCS
jgi:large subunit ribosomal protein L10